MDSQPAPTQNLSAVTTAPFDILHEIFSYCLPDAPLDDSETQPNTKTAPVLLCHVCSSWRRTALASPDFWTYLCYRIPVHWGKGYPVTWEPDVFLRDMACLRWWKRNQGSKAPALRFRFHLPDPAVLTRSNEVPLTHDDIRFFADLLSSAQYLDVSRLAVYVLKQDLLYTASKALCPNLRSLVIKSPLSDDNKNCSCLVPFYIPPTLRRLRVHDVHIPPAYVESFVHWSRLTHLSLVDMELSPDIWSSLIRAVPNLQWAYIDVLLELGHVNYDPPKFTLPHLATLSAMLGNFNTVIPSEPLRYLLLNLRLPALHDLSIYVSAYPSNLPGVAMKMNKGLTSVPGITKLTIAFQFLEYRESDDPHTSWAGVTKLSTLAPRLTHLVIDMQYMQYDGEYEETLPRRLGYWAEFLRPRHWVDLDSPASALRKVSVVVTEPSRDGPLVEDVLRGALGLDEAGYGEVVLEIVPEDRKGLAPYAEGYKTWGCPLKSL